VQVPRSRLDHRSEEVQGHLIDAVDPVRLGGTDTFDVDDSVVFFADRGRRVVGPSSQVSSSKDVVGAAG
jgi:hypothetical protein